MRLSAMPSAYPLPSTSPSGFSCAHITNCRPKRKQSTTAAASASICVLPLLAVFSGLIASVHLIEDGRHADAARDRIVAYERKRGCAPHAHALPQFNAEKAGSRLQTAHGRALRAP